MIAEGLRPCSRAVLLPLVAALALSGCASKQPEQSPSQALTTPASATTPTSSSTAVIPGGTAALTATMTALYSGGDVPTSGPATEALKARKAMGTLPASTAAIGTWAKEDVAVVQSDKDVTLLVKKGDAWTVVGGWWPGLGVSSTLTQKRFILVLGSDARGNEVAEKSRADAIHIVGFDGRDGGGIVGIARDTWVRLPNGKMGKINSAMSVAGPIGETQTVAQVSEIPVTKYLLVDFGGVVRSVDAVHGLPLDLPPEASRVGLTPGMATRNGDHTLRWARERHHLAAGDFARSHNQSLILIAGAYVIRSKGPTSLPGYMTVIAKETQTNLSAEEALTFFAQVFQVDPSKVHTGTAAGSGATSPGGASIVVAGPKEKALYEDFADGNLTKG